MAAKKKAPAEDAEEAKGGGKMKLIIIVVVLAVLGGAAYMFVLKPKGAAAEPKKPEPGAVVKLDPIQINLQGEHYLKLGLALQASKSAGDEVDGSKALDIAIDEFSGQDVNQLARRKYRIKLQKELDHKLEKAYEGDVYQAYFTDFVTQ